MDADTIIFYLVIIVFIISRIRRAMKEGDKAGSKKPKTDPAWKKALRDVMTEIQAGMETAAKPDGPVSGDREVVWEDIAVPAEYERAEPEESYERMQASARPENPREAEPSEKMAEIRRMIDDRRAGKSGISAKQEPVCGMPDRRGGGFSWDCSQSSQGQLRTAVIWSEILAPPLALRAPGGDPWQ